MYTSNFIFDIDLGVDIIISHSTDMNSGARYDIRLNLDRGASITKVSRMKKEAEGESEEERVVLKSKQLETNRLEKIFHPDQLYGGFFLKIKIKQDYTGITLAKAGEVEDPVLAVKDHDDQGKKDGKNLVHKKILINLNNSKVLKYFCIYISIIVLRRKKSTTVLCLSHGWKYCSRLWRHFHQSSSQLRFKPF